MPLKDLTGKTVYDLDQEDFEKLYCHQCRDCGICTKDIQTVDLCKQLIDNGLWDIFSPKRHQTE